MMTPDDHALLHQFAADQSEAAFAALVNRHLPLVHSAALRRAHGNAHLAAEIAQVTFIILARKAGDISAKTVLTGWLYRTTQYVAADALRQKLRRQQREHQAYLEATMTPNETNEAWQQLAPVLDEAMHALRTADRDAVLLRYFENKSLADVGAALGVTEDAARVRVNRALDKLRALLAKQGIKFGATLLATAVVENSVQAAPTALAATISSVATKSATTAASLGAGTKIFSSLTKVLLLSWLLPLLTLITNIPSLIAVAFIGRMERRNFREAEGFRPRLHWLFFRGFIWGFPLMLVLMALLNQAVIAKWGLSVHKVLLAVFTLFLTAISARGLVIARSKYQIGMFLYCAIIAVGLSLLALGWISQNMSQLPLLLATAWLMVTYNKRPMRMDYNLFLRAANNLLVADETAIGKVTDTKFGRSELLQYARFLSSKFLVSNYRWDNTGLMLRLPPVRSRFLNNMATIFLPPISQKCSYLVLGWDGQVGVHLGKQDLIDLHDLRLLETGTDNVTTRVANAVTASWMAFRKNDETNAAKGLGETPESEIFLVSPERSRSMRWWRIMLGASVTLMAIGMIMQFFLPKHSSTQSMFQPIQLSENQVKAALVQKARMTNFDEAIKFHDNLAPIFNWVLPPTNLMSGETLNHLRALMMRGYVKNTNNPAALSQLVYFARPVQIALLNGWFSRESLCMNSEQITNTIVGLLGWLKQQWFGLHELACVDNKMDENGKMHSVPGNYTVLDADTLAVTIQCLDKLGYIHAIDGTKIVETLLKHQILTDQIPAGRRPLANPKVYHGLFLTQGFDPIKETYDALVILSAFGALDRVNGGACGQGILRFYKGDGLFGWDKKEDDLRMFGDARDTFCAYESLRMLGALDLVKDLDKWTFRPNFTNGHSDKNQAMPATWDDMEAWVCQTRLSKIVVEHTKNPASPYPSLLN